MSSLIKEVGTLTSNSQLSEQGLVSWDTEHSVKIRNIEFLGTNTDHFITSGDDGFIRKWGLQSDSDVTFIKKVDAESLGALPFNVAVCPTAESVVAVYRHLDKLRVYSLGNEGGFVELQETPHKIGVSEIAFMPWRINGNPVFVTSGSSDHGMACWGMFNGKIMRLFNKEHTNIVTGICGRLDSFRVMSVGRDKRISVFDLEQEKLEKRDKVDVECVGVDANPIDSNLLCIQTSVSGSQLRLWDIREKNQVAAFGWLKAPNTKNTALVAPAWSPSGLLLTAGSGEEVVKIFDIRYHNTHVPLSVEKPGDRGAVYRVASWCPPETKR
ncbi:transducin/WD40 repeat family protein [Tanacetum coccineum]